jgi:hypothetical protein
VALRGGQGGHSIPVTVAFCVALELAAVPLFLQARRHSHLGMAETIQVHSSRLITEPPFAGLGAWITAFVVRPA